MFYSRARQSPYVEVWHATEGYAAAEVCLVGDCNDISHINLSSAVFFSR